MGNCSECGLAMSGAAGTRCYLTNGPVPEKPGEHWDCHFFSKTIVEDGLPLSPEQHYLIRRSELDGQK